MGFVDKVCGIYNELNGTEPAAEELDEETIINSEGFDSEYFAAIQYARDIAKVDAENIWNKISEEYNDEMGEEAMSEMILEAFNEFTFAETKMKMKKVKKMRMNKMRKSRKMKRKSRLSKTSPMRQERIFWRN